MAGFDRNAWDLNFRAELYKEEFYATDDWTNTKTRDAMVEPFDSSTTGELKHLQQLKQKERREHVGEIVREQDARRIIELWYEPMGITPDRHRLTIELLHATIHLAGSVAGCFKDRFNRVRPWVLAPDLFPPIPSPGLPSYPGGHSTQIYLMAQTMAHLAPTKARDIIELADNVAANRERAGLNYPSDTAAGKKLAASIFTTLKSQCKKFASLLERAKQAEW
jgi:hypothetical protein